MPPILRMTVIPAILPRVDGICVGKGRQGKGFVWGMEGKKWREKEGRKEVK